MFVLRSSTGSCCKEIPRIRRSTIVSTGSVSQSNLVILEGFSTPPPGRGPVLAHIRSSAPDLFRRFGLVRAFLRLAVAMCCLLWSVPGLAVLFGCVVGFVLVGLGFVVGLDLGGVRAVPDCFLVARVGSCGHTHVPYGDIDSSVHCRFSCNLGESR